MKNLIKVITGFACVVFGVLANILVISMLDLSRIRHYGVSHEINLIGGWFSFLFFKPLQLGIAVAVDQRIQRNPLLTVGAIIGFKAPAFTQE